MPTSSTPGWNDASSTPISLQVVARGATARGTINLSAKFGAYVLVTIARMGTTALTNGVDVLFRRMIASAARRHLGAFPQLKSNTIAASVTTCTAAGTPNPVGSSSLTVASTTGFAAGDLIAIQDSDVTPSASITEFARVAKVTSGTVLLLDAPTLFAHNNVAHTVRNKVDTWTVWLEGGCTYEVIIDYGDDSAGESITVVCELQDLANIASA